MPNLKLSDLPLLATPSTTTTFVIATDSSSGAPIDYRVAYSSGGGGGGTFNSVTAAWASGGQNKDAYSAPSVINNQGIVITFVAASGAGGITNATVTLGGTALTNQYSSTGTWPNLTITIPAADLAGNAAEIAASTAVNVVGTFNSGNFNNSAGTLTTTAPIPFTTVLTGSYTDTSLAFYVTTSTLNYSYTNPNGITNFGGVFTPTRTPLLPKNATSTSGSFANVDAGGATISGSATGMGSHGAPSGVVVALSGSVAAVPTFTPAFYAQTATSTAPTFTTSSSQTSGAATGSTISYPVATAFSQFNWIATTRPLTALQLQTTFGNNPLTPSSTSTVTIAGTSFNLFSWTGLGVGTSSVLVIN